MMNRAEFMTMLSSLLQDIEPEEREEALQYYNDYFDDAGSEREADVIKELESAEKVAAKIKVGLNGRDDESSEYRETGYTDTRFEKIEHPATREAAYQEAHYRSESAPYSYREMSPSENKKKPWTNIWLKILLIVLIIVVGCPLVIPLIIALAVIIVSLIIAIVAIIFAFLISGIAVAVSGIIMIVYGGTRLITGIIPEGLGFLGSGLIITALGVVLSVGIWWVIRKILPPLFRSITNLCTRIWNRIRRKEWL